LVIWLLLQFCFDLDLDLNLYFYLYLCLDLFNSFDSCIFLNIFSAFILDLSLRFNPAFLTFSLDIYLICCEIKRDLFLLIFSISSICCGILSFNLFLRSFLQFFSFKFLLLVYRSWFQSLLVFLLEEFFIYWLGLFGNFSSMRCWSPNGIFFLTFHHLYRFKVFRGIIDLQYWVVFFLFELTDNRSFDNKLGLIVFSSWLLSETSFLWLSSMLSSEIFLPKCLFFNDLYSFFLQTLRDVSQSLFLTCLQSCAYLSKIFLNLYFSPVCKASTMHNSAV